MDVVTFDDDLLGLSEFAKRLENFISVERHFVTGKETVTGSLTPNCQIQLMMIGP